MDALLTFLESHPAWLWVAVALLGLMVGSFLNVVIHRLPLMLERQWRSECESLLAEPAGETLPAGRFDLMVPRSRCPACGHMISAGQNIPLLSYLLLKGRCAHCGARISPRYPLVEAATAALSLAVLARFGLHPATIAALIFTWMLISISLIDADTTLLPDNLTLPLLWLGLLVSLLPGSGASPLFATPRAALIGAIAGYLSLWSVYQLFKLVTGREGMGYGDFKLLAALGAWMGWQMLPLIILLSAVVGALVGIAMIVFRGRDRTIPIPFGPYLAAAGWIAMLWGDTLNSAYLATFRPGG